MERLVGALGELKLMYANQLVAAIKVNGQILRESGDTVSLPFGCEYSVLVKNLSSVRSQISVSVDGKDAVGRIIIAPNSSIELERFIREGNLQAGNRFKFIERSGDIEKHRGVGSDDGLIRVEAWREKITQHIDVPVVRYVPQVVTYWPHYPYHPPYWMWDASCITTGNVTDSLTSGSNQGLCNLSFTASNFVGSVNTSSGSAPSSEPTASSQRPGAPQARTGPRPMHPASRGASLRSQVSAKGVVRTDSLLRGTPVEAFEQSDAGITVPGSESRQQFVMTSGFPLETQSIVIVLKLRGKLAGAPVVQPVTVSMKPKCETCGKQNKPDAQYCSKCGTALVVYA